MLRGLSMTTDRVTGAAPADIPVWDCHGHIYDDPGGARGRRLLNAMDKLGIQRIFVSRLWSDNRVPATATPEDVRRCNEAVAGWVERHPDRFIPYCFVNCTYPDEAQRELEVCVGQRGFRGSSSMRLVAMTIRASSRSSHAPPRWVFPRSCTSSSVARRICPANTRRTDARSHTWLAVCRTQR